MIFIEKIEMISIMQTVFYFVGGHMHTLRFCESRNAVSL